MTARLTWKAIAEIEPELLVLEEELKALEEMMRDEPRFCANTVWYGSYRDRLTALVGLYAEKPALRSEEPYDVAYDYLYDLLPDCRDCDCGGELRIV